MTHADCCTVESKKRKIRSKELDASHDEEPPTNRDRLEEATAFKGTNYSTQWSRVVTAITTAEACGDLNTAKHWITTRSGDMLPPFDQEVVKEICIWYLDNTELAQLTGVGSAVNAVYKKAGLPGPWTGYGRLLHKYEFLQFEELVAKADKAILQGKTPKLVRVEIPETDVKHLINLGEDEGITDELLGQVALAELGILGALRASSLKLRGQDRVTFAEDGGCTVMFDRTKGRDLIEEPLTIPPGPEDKPQHPRNRMLRTIKKAVDRKCIAIPKGGPAQASNEISNFMQKKLFKKAKLGKGKGLFSHSLRKTLASAAEAVKKAANATSTTQSWGGWQSEQAMRPYVNPHYKATKFSADLFDFLIHK